MKKKDNHQYQLKINTILWEAIEIAARFKSLDIKSWITQAVIEKLERDGYKIDTGSDTWNKKKEV